MEYDKIKQLMDDMGNSKLSSIDIEFPDGIKIKMTKDEVKKVELTSENQCNVQNNVSNNNVTDKISEDTNKSQGNIVTSPMVGTFYLKPSPNENQYVELGSKVKKGDILCIIEAMKLMNEIESEYDGEIAEIYAKDGEAVEYGKPLFRIV